MVFGNPCEKVLRAAVIDGPASAASGYLDTVCPAMNTRVLCHSSLTPVISSSVVGPSLSTTPSNDVMALKPNILLPSSSHFES